MGTKSFLAISIIVVLLIGTVSFDATFADKDEDKGKKDKTLKTFESECAKKLDKKKLNLDGLFCQAILGFQFTVESFYDIFVELEDIANFDCPTGEYAVGTGIDGELICASIPKNSLLDQRCISPEVMMGIDANGIIICDLVQDTPPPVLVLELCNGLDDDSNPATLDGIDEPWLGNSCDGLDADSCSEGFFQCTAGGKICTDTTGDNLEIPGNSIDDDCDGQIDEGAFVDDDNDGYASDVDCNDNDPLVHSGQISYFDADFDGYGDVNNTTLSCSILAGYVLNSADCDDTSPLVNPVATEDPSNGIDDNCNGIIDE